MAKTKVENHIFIFKLVLNKVAKMQWMAVEYF